MPTTEILETGAAVLLFAVIFLVGGRVHPLRGVVRDRRSLISFAAGMAAAYVFVHVMPELHGARRAFAESLESVSVVLRYEGMAIYFLALVGFLVFYGLDHLRARLRARADEAGEAEEGQAGPAFWIHVGGFAAYVLLVTYLLVHNLEETPVSTGLFVVAMACHFLAVDHSLRDEHGAAYDRIGRYLLAGMAALGWAIGLLTSLPVFVVSLLVAFVSGAVIMNSAVMELPSEKDGRFLPFMIGGVLYGLILLPLG
jgi:hypothetical protein